MSILINGMEMPTERESFQVTIKYNGVVLDTETGIQVAEAFSVPDHGRLIDADEADSRFIPDFTELSDFQCGWNAAMQRVCDDAPTIIPADRGGDA